MIPPRGFKNEIYPLRHRLVYSVGLSGVTGTMNSVFFTLVRMTNDVIANTPRTIRVNPHSDQYVKDAGAAVAKMSIIDKLTLSLKFNLTSRCNDKAHTSGLSGAEVFSGDGITHMKIVWRPIFFSFPEKLDAADDDTTTTVAAILALTKDATLEDVVPLTTNKLPTGGISDLSQPLSTINIAEVATTDYNMTTDATMEDHVWDEDLFQEALMRYTNRGALKACVGRTRTIHLTRTRPYHTDYIRKFVPRSIRRVMPYTFMGIQIHVPLSNELGGDYHDTALTPSQPHIGVKCIAQYHEWHADHNQEMTDDT